MSLQRAVRTSPIRAPGQELQSDGVRGDLVWMLGQRGEQAVDLLVGEPAFPALLVIALDAFHRVVRPHAPLDADRKIFDSSDRTRFAR